MSRKGQTWPLETIGKIILGGILLLGMFYVGYLLLDAMISGQENYRAQRNLEILDERINIAVENEEQTFSIVLQIPEPYFLVGWPQDAQTHPDTADDFAFKRPAGCDLDKSCLCLYTSSGEFPKTSVPVKCEEYKFYQVFVPFQALSGGSPVLPDFDSKPYLWEAHLPGPENEDFVKRFTELYKKHATTAFDRSLVLMPVNYEGSSCSEDFSGALSGVEGRCVPQGGCPTGYTAFGQYSCPSNTPLCCAKVENLNVEEVQRFKNCAELKEGNWAVSIGNRVAFQCVAIAGPVELKGDERVLFHYKPKPTDDLCGISGTTLPLLTYQDDCYGQTRKLGTQAVAAGVLTVGLDDQENPMLNANYLYTELNGGNRRDLETARQFQVTLVASSDRTVTIDYTP